MTALAFVAGLFIGATLGVFVAALAIAASDDEVRRG